MADILVIDRDSQFRRLWRIALGAAGHRVREASAYDHGAYRYFGDRADLVLVDLGQPYRDGLDTILWLRSVDPHVRIIAVADGPVAETPGIVPMALRFGAALVLLKPFDSDVLQASVRRVVSDARAPRCAQPVRTSFRQSSVSSGALFRPGGD